MKKLSLCAKKIISQNTIETIRKYLIFVPFAFIIYKLISFCLQLF